MTTEHDTDAHSDMEETFGLGARLRKSVGHGVLVALPLAYFGLVIALWLLTARNLQRSLETAALPGLLIGVFFGGFFGMAATLLSIEKAERAHKRSRRANR
jgi:hypothetical protein